ncbi:uncharacterized protein LOC132176160 isoform X1 [Corylus avellana]|uniref:uncharacterized protein LOC132176160 isoform X1 n=1 Tax=Corylus avellana TaxID=13451 RepID=UPI00286B5C7D|nr:uncharacterized protein LOC132176160 isoform X1 [Corylus avellana]
MAAAKESSASSSSTKVVLISPQLGCFLGASYCSRTQAVKLIWEYIKLHHLQGGGHDRGFKTHRGFLTFLIFCPLLNPENKREVFCDERLKSIFDGKDKVGFQEITSAVESLLSISSFPLSQIRSTTKMSGRGSIWIANSDYTIQGKQESNLIAVSFLLGSGERCTW